MDDVFFGDGPGYAWSIVELPRVIRLHVFSEGEEATRGAVAPERVSVRELPEPSTAGGRETGGAEQELVIRLRPFAEIPEPLSPQEVWTEFTEVLAEEDARDARFTFRVDVHRREKRAQIMARLRERPVSPSDAVHHRTRRSRWSLHAREQYHAPVPYRPTRSRAHADPFREVLVRPERRTPWTPTRSLKRFLQDITMPLGDQQEDTQRAEAVPTRRQVVSDLPSERSLVASPIPWARFRESPRVAPRRRATSQRRWSVPRARVWEAMRVGSAALIAGGVVGVLGSVSAVPRISRLVGTTAGTAAEHLGAGLQAIAVADVAAGQRELDVAGALFARAERELVASTNLATRLLGVLDPKERYVSGRKLLAAGQQLSDLGEDATKLILLFRGATGVPETLTETLEESVPIVQRLSRGLADVEQLTGDIPSDAVPESVRGDLETLQTSVRTLVRMTAGFVQSHDVLLELLGSARDRQYLFVFQNNREIRPTGGFIGSFALADVSQGEVRKVHVDTIYNPDGQLREYLIPPEPLQKLTDRWFTRDANWFADFRRSSRKIASLFERSGGPTVDGVIAVTPTVLERLLRVTGPISLPAYKTTVTADNIVDETQRLVTFDYDRQKNTPKAFIADLLPELLNRVVHLPRERWGDLVGVLADGLREKHILIFLRNPDAQARVEELHWAGAVEETDGDYLLRVEANVGGQKTDELIDTSVDYDVTIESDGTAVATLVTTRAHQGSRDGRPDWDPNVDWYRMPNIVYERTLVPKGSTLLEVRGFTPTTEVPTPFENTADYRTYVQDADLAALEEGSVEHESGAIIGEEEGKTSFGNWIVTQPGETTVTVYRYRLPFTVDLQALLAPTFRYALLLQQQPGHRPVHVRATVRIPPGFAIAWAGPDGSVQTEGERKATFTSVVANDSVWGVVAERQ